MRPLLLVLLGIGGCVGGRPDLDTGPPPYPLDDVLRVNDLQAKGTHNSYHVQTAPLDAWGYTHAPLSQQLSLEGVRQFELDLWWNPTEQVYSVFHIGFLDQGTTCPLLADCLAELKDWSDDNPRHHPLYVLLEVKDGFDEDVADDRLDALDAEVLAAWPESRLITPDLVRGEAATVREGLAQHGWPTLGEVRGRALFVLHEGGAWRDRYTDGLTTSVGRPLFPDAYGDLNLPFAAVHAMNDPFDSRIAQVVDAGHLVRTRADSDTAEAHTGDTTRRDQALASGAHFVSTDFPVPAEETGYVVEIPDGAPSRCNPRTAPEACTPGAVETLR